MNTDSPRQKLKQICRECSDHRGVKILRNQTDRATLTAVLLGGFIMELAKTVLPILYGARIPDAGRKLAAFTSGIILTVGINLIYDRIGCWIQELEDEIQQVESQIVQEEQDIEDKIQDIEQSMERRVGKN